MKVSRFVANSIGENTYILWNGEGSDAAIVDPGMMGPRERQAVDHLIADNHLHVKMVLMTHLHFDHAASAHYVASRYGVEIYAHPADAPLGQGMPQQSRMFGLDLDIEAVNIDVEVTHLYTIELNGEKIEMLHTPGHTPGGMCYHLPESALVLTGDTLFDQSIGRTDLPGGDYGQIIDSIKSRLFTLPPDTVVLPGHGGSTTIGDEMNFNPYVKL